MKSLAFCVTLLLLVSCTSTNVKRIDLAKNSIEPICIEKNPKVIVEDFLPVLTAGISRHGVAYRVVDKATYDCKSILTYTALRSWDVTPYLSHAELTLTRNGVIIGSATYHHNGGSMSLAPTKWFSVESKMSPVIDELFSNMANQ